MTDKTGRYPEVDPATQAPEYYPLPEGLQTSDGNAPEPVRNREPPILQSNKELPEIANNDLRAQSYVIRKSVFWIIACLLILLVALGVGLGVGLTNARNRQDSGPPGAQLNSTNGTGSPTLKNGVLNDTSIAAVVTSDGDKHLFFQDINGTLRHTVWVSSANTWLSTVDFVLASPQPRTHSPIAVYPINEFLSTPTIIVFYVAVNDTLAAVLFHGSGTAQVLFNGSFPVSPTGRSLGVSRIVSSNASSVDDLAVLFYEAPSGNITALNGGFGGFTGSSSTVLWYWQNVTDAFTLPATVAPNAWLGAPFAVITLPGLASVHATFFNPVARYNTSASLQTIIHFDNFTEPDAPPNSLKINPAILTAPLEPVSVANINSMSQSDWIQFYVEVPNDQFGVGAANEFAYVINQTLMDYSYAVTQPLTTPFPFSRLTLANSTNTSSIFIYHQMNESTLAEDQFINEVGWNTAMIRIPTA